MLLRQREAQLLPLRRYAGASLLCRLRLRYAPDWPPSSVLPPRCYRRFSLAARHDTLRFLCCADACRHAMISRCWLRRHYAIPFEAFAMILR